jgi:hypothetical protein
MLVCQLQVSIVQYKYGRTRPETAKIDIFIRFWIKDKTNANEAISLWSSKSILFWNFLKSKIYMLTWIIQIKPLSAMADNVIVWKQHTSACVK